MTCVLCLASLDHKKKVDILSSLNAKCIIPNNHKNQLKFIFQFLKKE
ncbi:unnamed protein product, partial [Musa banksii]